MHSHSVHVHVHDQASYLAGFSEFISESPTSYHAAKNLADVLVAAGFSAQQESAPWAGHTRGFIRRDGALIAWRIPDGATAGTGFRIVGSHTDSPTFRLKPNPGSLNYGFGQVNVEIYGGPLINSWFNRDLGIAGRLTLIDGEEHLVATPPCMVIPQLAPHLDRSVYKRIEFNAQRDFHPIWTIGEDNLLDYLAGQAGVAADHIAGFDLFAYDAQAPAVFGGPEGETFLAAGRQDNLSSVYPSLLAFLGIEGSDFGTDIAVFAAFDHEEVGSETYTGARGPFLENVLRRISAGLVASGDSVVLEEEAYLQALANSSCLSADAGHSVNPNRAELHDPDHHPILGGGPLLKVNADAKYASEATGSALWLRACHAAGEASQEFVSNNEVPCGSTIGPATAARLGIVTVDVGIPLLSMHSVRELSAPCDHLAFARILAGYWSGV